MESSWSRCSQSLLHQQQVLGWARNLAAHARRRKDFLRVQYVPPVEGIAQADHDVEILVGEQQRHQVTLLQSDSVFPGDGAAGVNAELQYLPAGRLYTLKLLGIAHVEKDQGMKIAVSRVEDVADSQIVFLGDIPDVSHHRGYLTARHHAVLGVVRRCHPAQCGESHLASLP